MTTQFTMEIAGVKAEISPIFASTRDYCRNYWCPGTGEIQISVSREDLAAEQAWLDREAEEEGLKRRKFTEPFLERNAIQRKLAQALLPFGVCLIHGSAVAVDGRGYLFTAPCGTGKSTHARLWVQTLGAQIINDDKPFLRFTDSGVLVCGSPWGGKHGLENNITVPLQGICILERGVETEILPLTPAEALPFLLHQCYPQGDAIGKALSAVSLWRLRCSREKNAAVLAFQAMGGKIPEISP